MKTKTIYIALFYYLALLFLEVAFKLFIFEFNAFKAPTLNMLLYLLPVSLFLALFTKMFSPKANKIIFFIILSGICFWFALELGFKLIFNTFFCLSLFGLADQAAQFASDGIKHILINSYAIVTMFVPLIIAIWKYRKDTFKRQNKKTVLVISSLIILSLGLYAVALFPGKDKNTSAHYLIYSVNNNDLNVEKLGVSLATYLDLQRTLFGFSEKIDNNQGDNTSKGPDVIVDPIYDYNINKDIDFDLLINTTSNKTLKSMHEYFKNDYGTQQNEYTGMYEDKNLIVIMAESFNEIAVREDLTPTLYKLVNESFVFDNFYTPINLSTIGGEFQELTGMFANLSALSKIWRKGKNYFPYGIGTMFKDQGYNTYAYHANSGKFQDRNVYLKSIGLDNFLYCGNGLEKLMNCSKWPSSDLDLVNVTLDDIITKNADSKFLAYYVSISGHMPYSLGGNAMYRKNNHLVKDLPYSDQAKGYLASQIELDKALEAMLKILTESGKLDDTVIALVADHYPYGLDLSVVNELASYEKDEIIEINKSNLIIWNSKTETKHITKVASQLDFMPTLYNLFGLKYDSRLFIGKDILSNEPGLVFFTNRSWITDYGKYYASSGKFAQNPGEIVNDDYVKNINSVVSNKINMSKLIMEKDYYKLVLGDK